MNNFKRGDIILVNFHGEPTDPTFVIKGQRPAVVIQDPETPGRTVTVAPITDLHKANGTKKRTTYTNVVLFKSNYPNDTIVKDSMIKLEQLQTISRSQLGKKLGEVNEKDKLRLDISLIASLGLQERVEELIQGAITLMMEKEETGD